MARIKSKSFTYTAEGIPSNSISGSLPGHDTGDLLLAIVNRHNDNNNNMAVDDGTWAEYPWANNQSPNNLCRLFFKVATSAAEPDVSFSSSRVEEWSLDFIVIENQDIAGSRKTFVNPVGVVLMPE